MLQNIKRIANVNIPDSVIQGLSTVLAFLAILSSLATILNVLNTPWFNWFVLAAAVFGLLGPYSYFRDNKKFRLVAVLLGFVAGLFAVALLLDFVI